MEELDARPAFFNSCLAGSPLAMQEESLFLYLVREISLREDHAHFIEGRILGCLKALCHDIRAD